MKTALTELIEWSENDLEIFIEDTDEALRIYEAIKVKATELLEKEKEQIEEAYYDGVRDSWTVEDTRATRISASEQYYNETFNQQPEVDYQKMFANCSLPNETHKLREAATNIIQKWKGKCAITSADIQRLEKAMK